MTKRRVSPRFVTFVIVGCVSTCIDFFCFYVLYTLLGWHVALANAVGYGVGLTNSFFINRRVTFADAKHRGAKRIWVSWMWGYIGLGMNTSIVWGLSFFISAYIAKAIAVIIIILFNYNTNKRFVFGV